MKHDYKRQQWPTRLRKRVCRSIAQWRQDRATRLAFMEISRRQNAHLLEDIGLERWDADRDPADGAERHRFWML